VRHGSAVRSPGKRVALGGRLSAGGGGVGVRTAPGLAGVVNIAIWIRSLCCNW